MGSKRYTVKALKADIAELNQKIKESGIPSQGFYKVTGRNAYHAVDFMYPDRGVGVCDNIDCAEPPRVLLERAQTHFNNGSWKA